MAISHSRRIIGLFARPITCDMKLSPDGCHIATYQVMFQVRGYELCGSWMHYPTCLVGLWVVLLQYFEDLLLYHYGLLLSCVSKISMEYLLWRAHDPTTIPSHTFARYHPS
jgi:hypothetical protein